AVMDSISYWHGVNTPFVMSLIVVALGTLLVLTMNKWKSVYEVLPCSLSFNRVYDSSIKSVHTSSDRLTNAYMTGSVRTYCALSFATTFIITFYFMYKTNGFSINFTDLANITVLEIVVVSAIIVAAFGTIFSNNNLAAILILGITGYGVTILFVL